VNVPGHAKDTLPGFLVRGVYRCIFGGQNQAGLKNLKEDYAKKADHPDRDHDFGEGEGGSTGY
jgi:hypothetical protein